VYKLHVGVAEFFVGRGGGQLPIHTRYKLSAKSRGLYTCNVEIFGLGTSPPFPRARPLMVQTRGGATLERGCVFGAKYWSLNKNKNSFGISVKNGKNGNQRKIFKILNFSADLSLHITNTFLLLSHQRQKIGKFFEHIWKQHYLCYYLPWKPQDYQLPDFSSLGIISISRYSISNRSQVAARFSSSVRILQKFSASVLALASVKKIDVQ